MNTLDDTDRPLRLLVLLIAITLAAPSTRAQDDEDAPTRNDELEVLDRIDVARLGAASAEYVSRSVIRVEFGHGAARQAILFYLDADGRVARQLDLDDVLVYPARLNEGFATISEGPDSSEFVLYDGAGEELRRYSVPSGRLAYLNEGGLMESDPGQHHAGPERPFDLLFRPAEGGADVAVKEPDFDLVDVFEAGVERWGVVARQHATGLYQARLYDPGGAELWRTDFPELEGPPTVATLPGSDAALASISAELGSFEVVPIDAAGELGSSIGVAPFYAFKPTDDPARVFLLSHDALQVLDLEMQIVVANFTSLPRRAAGESLLIPPGTSLLAMVTEENDGAVALRVFDLEDPSQPVRLVPLKLDDDERMRSVVGHRFEPDGNLVLVFPDGPLSVPAEVFEPGS